FTVTKLLPPHYFYLHKAKSRWWVFHVLLSQLCKNSSHTFAADLNLRESCSEFCFQFQRNTVKDGCRKLNQQKNHHHLNEFSFVLRQTKIRFLILKGDLVNE